MKIKTKKQLNLPQLIEWLLKSGHRNYIANSDMGNTVTLSRGGAIQFSFGTFFPEETFTVEVEEEITEDTVIPKMLEMSFDAYQNVVLDIQVNQSINTVKENAEVLTLHIINDHDTHTLIWRDGELVE